MRGWGSRGGGAGSEIGGLGVDLQEWRLGSDGGVKAVEWKGLGWWLC